MNARRLTLTGLVLMCAMVSTLALGGGVAWAAAPTVAEESFSNVGSTDATVSAQVGAEGSPTGYRVEYGTAGIDESSAPEAGIGAPEGAVGVSVQLTGLQSGVEYHFRFVATNALNETTLGGEMSFITSGSASASESALPDNRAYELVSPPGGPWEIYNNSLPVSGEGDFYTDKNIFQAAADGSAVAYVADPSVTNGNGTRGKGAGNQWLARRSTTGWKATDVMPAGEGEEGLEAAETKYEGFSSQLSVGIVTAASQPLALEAQPQAPTGCKGEDNHDLFADSGAGILQSLFASTQTPGLCGAPLFAGASADGTQVFFQDEAQLTAQAPEVTGKTQGTQGCDENCDLYESSGGNLSLVNVLPNGEPAGGATFGSAPQGPSAQPPGVENAISHDGSHVFWTDTQAGPDLGHVYVRDNGTSTIAVSQGAARYWTATPDGRYAFYTEGERLWRFDTESGAREELAGEGLKGESAGVQGVIGASEDGSYVYFVAEGALAPGAESRVCKTAGESRSEAIMNGSLTPEEDERDSQEESTEKKGESPLGRGCNLYFVHVGEAPKLVTVLTASDDSISEQQYFSTGSFQAGDWQSALGARTAEVAPDGQGLVFESSQRLTGYDDSEEGRPALEVFVYEAAAERVSCVSCSPTGAPLIPRSELRGNAEEQGGSYIPIHPSDYDGGNTSPVRWISADGGEAFFDTDQPLVPQDTNGAQDVYEWEREGGSSCPAQDHARLEGGCDFLLSSGESGDTFLIAASASGNDVFLSTRARLVPQVDGEKSEVYDVRVGGGIPEYPLACNGTGCQGVPPAPPIFATPSSVTFTGVGNFEASPKAAVKPKAKTKACKKSFVRKRGRCVKKKAGKSGKRSKRRKK
jgi:hypothetical protein